ncbi:MAG: Fic family protein [Deltaproteobacteria bacterium]|jgi:death-on-curing protein|nr:Fic family protein [Deltaproteobacteria bacterium]
MNTLNKDQVKYLHKLLLDRTVGTEGIRDEGSLESALANPFQTFDGVELYPSIASKIARIVYGLVCNHPFVDGNKRVGVYLTLVLLELNHFEVDFSQDDAVRIGLELASGVMNDRRLLELILDREK